MFCATYLIFVQEAIFGKNNKVLLDFTETDYFSPAEC
jgi:hypothetical protein